MVLQWPARKLWSSCRATGWNVWVGKQRNIRLFAAFRPDNGRHRAMQSFFISPLSILIGSKQALCFAGCNISKKPSQKMRQNWFEWGISKVGVFERIKSKEGRVCIISPWIICLQSPASCSELTDEIFTDLPGCLEHQLTTEDKSKGDEYLYFRILSPIRKQSHPKGWNHRRYKGSPCAIRSAVPAPCWSATATLRLLQVRGEGAQCLASPTWEATPRSAANLQLTSAAFRPTLKLCKMHTCTVGNYYNPEIINRKGEGTYWKFLQGSQLPVPFSVSQATHSFT